MIEFLQGIDTHAQGAITALATVAIAALAFVTAWLTYWLIQENKRLRKLGSEPQVVAYLNRDSLHKTVVNLAIVNVGQGPAQNVRFLLDGDDKDFQAHEVQISNLATRTPASLLPQGEKIEALFGIGHKLMREPRLAPFKVRIDYENLGGSRRRGVYSLDISQFDGLVTVGVPADLEIAEALKKIERHLGSYASGARRLRVETITEAGARAEEQSIIAKARQELARHPDKIPPASGTGSTDAAAE